MQLYAIIRTGINTNTFITLTARSISPDLVIVARSNDPATERKLLKAGAAVGVNVLALRRRGQKNVETGSISDATLEAGDVLIVLGTRGQLDALRQVA